MEEVELFDNISIEDLAEGPYMHRDTVPVID
jgi:hypothetical protein